MNVSDKEYLVLPRLDQAALPDLEVLTAVYGSRADVARHDAEDDNNAELLPCLYPFAFFD